MTAPWNPNSAKPQGRDAFAAFTCDETTAALVREAVAALGWNADKISTGGLPAAVAALSTGGCPQTLLIDLSETGEPMDDLGALAEVCEPGTLVVAIGAVNDVALYRALVGSGIHDYLVKPFGVDALRDSLAAGVASLAQAKVQEADAARPRVGVTVIGARGGTGASSLAASLAWALADRAKRNTALLDLDLYFGTAALAFDLEPGRGLIDALENPGRIDQLFIERAMVKTGERLSVLSAEAAMSVPLAADGVALHHLHDEMRHSFEAVIVDMPRSMAIEHPELVADAGHILVVTEQTLACTRDTIRLLGWLKSAAPTAKVSVVVNKLPSSPPPEVSARDFAASIERAVDVSLPLDAKLAGNAARAGKCMAAAGGAPKFAAAFDSLVTHVTGEGVAAASSGKMTVGDLVEKLGVAKLLKRTPKEA